MTPSIERADWYDGDLKPRQAETLVRLLESAPAVGNRPQFFVWSQGPLHALLPHRALVCGSWVRQRRDMELTVFHSVVLSAGSLSWLGDAASPLMAALAARWVAASGALAVQSKTLEGSARKQSETLLTELGCDTWLVHGVARPQRPHEIESFFVAAAEPGPGLLQGADRLLDLALPSLHATWRRVQPTDAGSSSSRVTDHADLASTSGRGQHVQLTDREREILRLAQDGRTNAAIGATLNISPLTVKNHIQKILRKFKARNRAQAVALAMAHGLLGEQRN